MCTFVAFFFLSLKVVRMSGEEAEIRFNFAKTVPSKDERERCWAARDEFWKCMKSIYDHGPLAPGAPRPKVNYDKCRDLRRAYKSVCPQTWVCLILS